MCKRSILVDFKQHIIDSSEFQVKTVTSTVVAHFAEIWILFYVQLGKEFVSRRKLGCIVCWKAVFRDFSSVVAFLAVYAGIVVARNSQHSLSIIDANHEIIDVVRLNILVWWVIVFSYLIDIAALVLTYLWIADSHCLNLRLTIILWIREVVLLWRKHFLVRVSLGNDCFLNDLHRMDDGTTLLRRSLHQKF